MLAEELIKSGVLGNAYIDERIRQNLEQGYCSDSCVWLRAIGFPGKENQRISRGEALSFVEETTQTVPIFMLEEMLFEIGKELSVQDSKKNKERLIKALNRPTVRIVDESKIKTIEEYVRSNKEFIRKINPDLYGKLQEEKNYAVPSKRVRHNDICFMAFGDYERTILVSFDGEVNRIACKLDLRYEDTRVIKKLPREYTSGWESILGPKSTAEASGREIYYPQKTW